MKIDVIIPVYKPEKDYLLMLEKIGAQSVGINKIIVINVEQKFYDRLMYSSRFLDEHKNMEVHHIAKREHDKGKALNMGVKLSDADYFIVMRQNAVPESLDVFEKLLKAFENNKDLAVAYAKVLSSEDAPSVDKFVRDIYYPENSSVHTIKDVDRLSYNAYFSSNYCAMYNRAIFDENGGFLNHVIYNEDVLYASKAINDGHGVAYVADAAVRTGAVLSEKDMAKFGFDYAVSMLKHPEVFETNKVKDDVKKLEKNIIVKIKRSGASDYLESKRRLKAFKKGFSKGLKFKKIAISDIPKYSLNPEYWRMDEILTIRNAVDVHSGYGRSKAELEMLSTPPVKGKRSEE